MLFDFDKRHESLHHVDLRPKRVCVLESSWEPLDGEGSDPCRTYGAGVLKQRRLGDICPYLDRSLRVRQNTRSTTSGSAWSEPSAEPERQALLAAHDNGDLEAASSAAIEWLAAVNASEGSKGFRNRVFPRSWRSSAAADRLHLAEQAILNAHAQNGSEAAWVNWNCMNFWHLPGLDEFGLDSEYAGALTKAIEHTRSRAVVWLNSTDFHGTQTPTPDLYGSESGSVTVEFWLKPRRALEPGVVLHVPGYISICTIPDQVSDPARAIGDRRSDDRCHLAFVSESLASPSNTIGDFLGSITSVSDNWNDNGWFATEQPSLEIDRWNHCSVAYDASTNQIRVYVNKRIAYARTYHSGLAYRFWWVRGNSPSEFLCLGARPLSGPYGALNPVTDPTNGEFSLNPERDITNEPSVQYHDPYVGEIHSLRVWSVPITLAQTEEGIGGVGLDDPLRDRLLFEAEFAYRGDSPPSYRASLAGFWDYASEPTPLNSVVGWTRGDVVLNLESFLCDTVNENWGLGVGSFSERVVLPSVGTDGEGIVSSDFYQALFGVRNLAILPCDNSQATPKASRIQREHSFVPEYLKVQTGYANAFVTSRKTMTDAALRESIADSGSRFPVIQSLRLADSRANTFMEITNLFYGSEVTDSSFAAKVDVGLSWLLCLLRSRAPIETFMEDGSPLVEGVPFEPDPVISGLYVQSVKSAGGVCWIGLQSVGPNTLVRGENGLGFGWQVGTLDGVNGTIATYHPALWRLFDFDYRIEFEGKRGLWVKSYLLPVPKGPLESTSPMYVPAYADHESLPYIDSAPLIGSENTLAITDVELYDKTLNVVVRAKMAQPIYRVPADEMAFKVKIDF